MKPPLLYRLAWGKMVDLCVAIVVKHSSIDSLWQNILHLTRGGIVIFVIFAIRDFREKPILRAIWTHTWTGAHTIVNSVQSLLHINKRCVLIMLVVKWGKHRAMIKEMISTELWISCGYELFLHIFITWIISLKLCFLLLMHALFVLDNFYNEYELKIEIIEPTN